MGRFAAGIWAEPFWQFYVSWPKISSFTKLACWDGPFLCGNAKALVVCARNVWSDYTSFLGGVKLDLEFHYKKDIRSGVLPPMLPLHTFTLVVLLGNWIYFDLFVLVWSFADSSVKIHPNRAYLKLSDGLIWSDWWGRMQSWQNEGLAWDQ